MNEPVYKNLPANILCRESVAFSVYESTLMRMRGRKVVRSYFACYEYKSYTLAFRVCETELPRTGRGIPFFHLKRPHIHIDTVTGISDFPGTRLEIGYFPTPKQALSELMEFIHLL